MPAFRVERESPLNVQNQGNTAVIIQAVIDALTPATPAGMLQSAVPPPQGTPEASTISTLLPVLLGIAGMMRGKGGGGMDEFENMFKARTKGIPVSPTEKIPLTKLKEKPFGFREVPLEEKLAPPMSQRSILTPTTRKQNEHFLKKLRFEPDEIKAIVHSELPGRRVEDVLNMTKKPFPLSEFMISTPEIIGEEVLKRRGHALDDRIFNLIENGLLERVEDAFKFTAKGARFAMELIGHNEIKRVAMFPPFKLSGR